MLRDGFAAPTSCLTSQEDIRILYEDDDLLLVRKPDLLLSVPGRHPEPGLPGDTPATALPDGEYRAPARPGYLGHHGDSAQQTTHAHISRQFQQRLVEKSTTRRFGVIAQDRGEIDLPIACDWPTARASLSAMNGVAGRSPASRCSSAAPIGPGCYCSR